MQVGPQVRVSCLPIPDAPFIHLTLTLERGMETETEGEWGYLSMLATLLNRGCGSLDRAAFAEDCDQRGANLNVYPGRDYLTLELWILPKDLSWALSTFYKMIWDTKLAPRELELAKEEHRLQLQAREGEKRSKLFDVARASLFDVSDPYARPMLGTESDIGAASPASLESFRQRYLKSVPAVLCVTGQFEVATVESLVREWYPSTEQPLASQNSQLSRFLTPPKEAALIPFPVDQAEVLLALPALERGHPDYRLAHFSNEILGGAFLSRLTRAVRMKEGMAYSADSRLRAGLRAGVIWIGLQTDCGRVGQALQTVRSCLDELREQGLSQDEFHHFRDFVLDSMPFEYDSLSSLTSRRLEELLFGEPWTLESRRANFEQRVTHQSTQEFLKSVLQPDLARLWVLGEELSEDFSSDFFAPSKNKVSTPLALLEAPSFESDSATDAELLHSNETASLYRLCNGLHILHLPRPELASVSLQVWTMTGSMDETPGKTGLSHLLEHLMFRGTNKHPDGNFDAILAQKGGLNNAFTSEDFTVYTDYVSKQGLPEALLLEADRFRHLDVTEELFYTERSVVMEERSVRVDCSPLGKAYETLQKLAFPEHAYGHPIIGWREDLEAIELDDLMSHYHEASKTEKLLLVVAGACEKDELLEWSGRAFEGRAWSAQSQEKCWPIEAPSGPVSRLLPKQSSLEERSGYSYLLLCYRFPREGHPDFEACELLARIVGEGDSSRLYERFVRENQRVLEVWTSLEAQCRDHPLLHLGMATPRSLKEEDLAQEVAEFLHELSDSLRPEDLEKARNSWRAEVAFGTDELEDWALEIAARVVLMPWDEVWRHEERMMAVTLDDLKRVASHYLSKEGLVHLYLHGTK